jgi:hypothetical protein
MRRAAATMIKSRIGRKPHSRYENANSGRPGLAAWEEIHEMSRI